MPFIMLAGQPHSGEKMLPSKASFKMGDEAERGSSLRHSRWSRCPAPAHSLRVRSREQCEALVGELGRCMLGRTPSRKNYPELSMGNTESHVTVEQ